MTAQIEAANTVLHPAVTISGYIGKPFKPNALISILLTSRYTESDVSDNQLQLINQYDTSIQQNLNISILEDNDINQQVVIEMLKNLHCRYHLAENDQEALNVLKGHTELYDFNGLSNAVDEWLRCRQAHL